MSPGDSHPDPVPVSPDPDQVTPSAARSTAATEVGQPKPDSADRLAYSIDEVVRLTGLSRDLLYDEMRRGRLAYVKVGRRRLITRQRLQQFLGDIPR
jgi:excisionase family DNA binding protein